MKIESEHRDGHLRAFDIVDYVLYIMATVLFVLKASSIFKSAPALKFPNIFILLFVVVVFLRNYVVMHAIDNRHEGDDLQFVALNVGWRYRLERVLRALIVFVVITTPQGAFDFISNPVTYLSGLAQALIGLLPTMVVETQEPPHPDIFNFFAYYATLLGILFVLFIAWDLTNIFSVSSGIRVRHINWGEIVYDADGKKVGVVFHEAVNTLMIYCNVADRVTCNGKRGVSFKGFFVHEEFGERCAEEGRFLGVYLRSTKIRERVLGLLVAFSILYWVSSKCSFPSSVPLLFLVGSYVAVVTQNREFFPQMQRVLLLVPIWEYLGARKA